VITKKRRPDIGREILTRRQRLTSACGVMMRKRQPDNQHDEEEGREILR
jgi:hypothetical protein